jgi:hypothetical protein
MSTDGSSGVGAASGEPRPRLGSRIVSVAEVIGPQTVVQWCDLWGTERNQQPALERAHGRRSCGGRRASTLTWRWGRSGCSSPSPAQVKLVFAGRTHQQERRSPLSRGIHERWRCATSRPRYRAHCRASRQRWSSALPCLRWFRVCHERSLAVVGHLAELTPPSWASSSSRVSHAARQQTLQARLTIS